jgi:hypothetical protein
MCSLIDAYISLGDARARWVTLVSRWVTLSARWVAFSAAARHAARAGPARAVRAGAGGRSPPPVTTIRRVGAQLCDDGWYTQGGAAFAQVAVERLRGDAAAAGLGSAAVGDAVAAAAAAAEDAPRPRDHRDTTRETVRVREAV